MSLNLSHDINAETIDQIECCICLDNIGKTNNCTTPCGHHFCFSCLMKSLSRNGTCPMCRATVVEEEEEDLDSEESEEDDDDDDDDEYEDEDDSNYATSDVIAERIQEKGYTMADIISIYIRRYKRNDPLKQSDEYIEKIFQDFDDIIDSSDREIEGQHNDRMDMMQEDTRRHHRSSPGSFLDNTNEDNVFGKLFS